MNDTGIVALPSEANFVLITGIDAAKTARKLERAGIYVRVLRSLAGIGDAIRLTIAPWPVMERALTALQGAQ